LNAAVAQPVHRGRLQVQGVDVPRPEPSRPWTQAVPRPAADAQADLYALEAGCTAAQQALRHQAFADARRYVAAAQQGGGANAPVRRSFRNRNLPPRNKTARVDIEVITGFAFV
jgi:hypothetical protein